MKRQLKGLAAHAQPDPAFVRHLALRINARIGQGAGWTQSWKWAVASVTAISLIGGATGVYAYTSDDVLPGHSLYAVRQGIEHIEEVATLNPAKKIAVQVKQLKRRLHENELLTIRKQDKSILQTQVDAFVKGVQTVLDDTSKLPESKQAEVDADVAKITANHAGVLLEGQKRADSELEKSHIQEILKDEQARIRKKIESLKDSRQQHFRISKPEELLNKSDR